MFHISEKWEKYRLRRGRYTSDTGDQFGAFVLRSPITGERMIILATDGEDPTIAEDLRGWQHVSVSLSKSQRLPTWQEMCWLKDAFWGPEDCVVQYHPAKSQYINLHEGVLHLWKHARLPFPCPPTLFVGPNVSLAKQ